MEFLSVPLELDCIISYHTYSIIICRKCLELVMEWGVFNVLQLGDVHFFWPTHVVQLNYAIFLSFSTRDRIYKQPKTIEYETLYQFLRSLNLPYTKATIENSKVLIFSLSYRAVYVRYSVKNLSGPLLHFLGSNLCAPRVMLIWLYPLLPQQEQFEIMFKIENELNFKKAYRT